MSQDEVKRNVGQRVIINGRGDLGIDAELRTLINRPELDIVIVKLTKGGKAYLQYGKTYYTVPVRNVDLFHTVYEKWNERQSVIKEMTNFVNDTNNQE